MLNFIKYQGGGEVCDIPGGGSYLLNSLVSISDTDLIFHGIGHERTKFLVNNSVGGLRWTSTGRSNTEYRFEFEGASFVSTGANGSKGQALSVRYPASPAAPATPTCRVENVNFRGNSYTVNPASSPYLTTGLHIQNAYNCQIADISSQQNSNDQYIAIDLDYGLSTAAFMLRLRDLSLQGGLYGIKGRGWFENLQISNFEIAAPRYAISLDASGVITRPPLITLSDGHANGVDEAVLFRGFKSVHVSNVNVNAMADVRSTQTTVYGYRIENCEEVTVVGGIANDIVASDKAAQITDVSLMTLSNVEAFSVSSQFRTNWSGTLSNQRAITIANGSKQGVVSGSVFRSNSTSGPIGILCQPNVGDEEAITIANNIFYLYGIGIYYIDMTKIYVLNNNMTGTATHTQQGGTLGGSSLISGNG